MLKVLIFGLLALAASACNQPPLKIEDAWIRTPLPGQDRAGGYFKLTNLTGQPIQLLGAQSILAEHIEIHQTREVLGVMQMRPLDQITIDAGEQIAFDGMLHLMLLGIDQSLRSTEGAKVTLLFSGGRRLTANFAVRKQGLQENGRHPSRHESH